MFDALDAMAAVLLSKIVALSVPSYLAVSSTSSSSKLFCNRLSVKQSELIYQSPTSLVVAAVDHVLATESYKELFNLSVEGSPSRGMTEDVFKECVLKMGDPNVDSNVGFLLILYNQNKRDRNYVFFCST